MRTGKLPKSLPRPSHNTESKVGNECIILTLALLTFPYIQVNWTKFFTWHGMGVIAYYMDKFDGTTFTATALVASNMSIDLWRSGWILPRLRHRMTP